MTIKLLIASALLTGGWLLPPTTPPGRPAPAPTVADSGNALRLTLAPEGNEARYRVREQLVNLDLPSDAVGATRAITGSLALDAAGNVIPAQSLFVVDVSTLKSDRERRDGYLQRRTLETAQFPTVMLAPTALRGLPWPLPTAGTFAFEMDADLTIKAVTRGVRWRVEAEAVGGGFTGRASTSFPFEAFGLAQPRVSVVLSVENDIRLEYDFHFVPDTTSTP